MEIRATLTVDDHIAAAVRLMEAAYTPPPPQMSRANSLKAGAIAIALMAPAAAAVWLGQFGAANHFIKVGLGALTGLIGLFALSSLRQGLFPASPAFDPAAAAARLRQRIESGDAHVDTGSHAFKLTPEGVSWENDFGSVFRSWHGFCGVDETADHILLVAQRLFAIPVPKSAFRSREEARAFSETACRWHAEACQPAPAGVA